MTHPSVQVIRPVRSRDCLYCVYAHLLLLIIMHCYNITAIRRVSSNTTTVMLSQVLYKATTLTEYGRWGSLTLAPQC